MELKTLFIRAHWLGSAQFGFDPVKTLRSLRGIPRYVGDLFRFRSSYTGRLELLPCLHDWYEEGGTTKSEYFWQDLPVARKIFEAKPENMWISAPVWMGLSPMWPVFAKLRCSISGRLPRRCRVRHLYKPIL